MKRKTTYGATRLTISLPSDLAEWARQRASRPPFRGKLSAYIQHLVDEDLKEHRQQWASTEKHSFNDPAESGTEG